MYEILGTDWSFPYVLLTCISYLVFSCYGVNHFLNMINGISDKQAVVEVWMNKSVEIVMMKMGVDQEVEKLRESWKLQTVSPWFCFLHSFKHRIGIFSTKKCHWIVLAKVWKGCPYNVSKIYRNRTAIVWFLWAWNEHEYQFHHDMFIHIWHNVDWLQNGILVK